MQTKFPKPLSDRTYYDEELGTFIYHRTKPEDQWIVTYNAPTLLLWEAYHNFQYVTDKHFAKYVCKYVTKPEPSELFNIHEADAYKKQILVRFQYLTIKNAELFFYQQLLLKKLSRSEQDLIDNHSTYREAFQSFYPYEYSIITQDIIQSTKLKKSLYLDNYKNLINNILISV